MLYFMGKLKKVQVTVSGNIQKAGEWSRLKNHMARKTDIKHSNDYLNTSESKRLRKYNQHLNFVNFDKFTHDKFMPYIKDHDAHANGHFQYKNVYNYMHFDGHKRELKHQMDSEYVAKFSDFEGWNDFFGRACMSYAKTGQRADDPAVQDHVYRAVSAGLADYAKSFNKRNPHVVMFDTYIHMDEKGAPHLHAHIMPYVNTGINSKGRPKKPSTSLNRALRETYGVVDTRACMRKFRDSEDHALIDSMNKALQAYGITYKLSLMRKKKIDPNLTVGQSHADYVAQKHQVSAMNNQIKKLNKQYDALKAQYDDKKNDYAVLQREYHDLEPDYRIAKQKIADADKTKKKAEDQQKRAQKMLDDANEKSKKINSMYNELHVVLEQAKKYRDTTEKYMKKLAKKAERPARWVVGVMMQGLREKFDGNSKNHAVRTLHEAGELYYLRNKKGKLANKQVIDEVYDETEQEVNARNAQARKDMEQAHKNIQNMSDFENDYDDYKGLDR